MTETSTGEEANGVFHVIIIVSRITAFCNFLIHISIVKMIIGHLSCHVYAISFSARMLCFWQRFQKNIILQACHIVITLFKEQLDVGLGSIIASATKYIFICVMAFVSVISSYRMLLSRRNPAIFKRARLGWRVPPLRRSASTIPMYGFLLFNIVEMNLSSLNSATLL